MPHHALIVDVDENAKQCLPINMLGMLRTASEIHLLIGCTSIIYIDKANIIELHINIKPV